MKRASVGLTTVGTVKLCAWLGTLLLIATAAALFVETVLLLLGVHRQPPYYLVALFAAGAFFSEIARREG